MDDVRQENDDGRCFIMKKYFRAKTALAISLIIGLLFSMTGTAFAKDTPPSPHFDYVALGDSLAAGQNPFGAENGYSYTNSIKNMLAMSGSTGSYRNFGVSGYTTFDISNQLNDPKIIKYLTDAEIVTLNIGANDLLGLPAVRNYFAAPTQENLTAATIEVTAELPNIGSRIATIIGSILVVNPDAEIYVMGYYNAFPSNPNLLNLILALNNAISYATVATGTYYVDTMSTFISDYLPNALDIHPTHDGYKAIAEDFGSAIGL